MKKTTIYRPSKLMKEEWMNDLLKNRWYKRRDDLWSNEKKTYEISYLLDKNDLINKNKQTDKHYLEIN